MSGDKVELGVCPRSLTSDVAARVSKLNGLLSPRGGRATSEGGRERQDAAVLAELRKMRSFIERRVEYLRAQCALAVEAAEQEAVIDDATNDVDDALLFGHGDFLEDGLFSGLDGFGDEGLFGPQDDDLNLFTELSPPLPPPPPPPPPETAAPPAASASWSRKRQRDESPALPAKEVGNKRNNKKVSKKERVYVRLRLTSNGATLARARASLAADSAFVSTLSTKHVHKQQKKKDDKKAKAVASKQHKAAEAADEPPLDPKLGPPCRSEKDGATTHGLWQWLNANVYNSNTDDLHDLISSVRCDNIFMPDSYVGSPLLSSLLVDDEDGAESPGSALEQNPLHTPNADQAASGLDALNGKAVVDSLVRRFVAALVPPADTLTARRKPPEREAFTLPSIVDKDAAYEQCLIAACLDAGIEVNEDGASLDSHLYVRARQCAAKLRRAQARNSTIVANLANAFLKRQHHEASQARFDLHCGLRWMRFQKRQTGELKKRKAEAKAQRKNLPW